MTNFTEKMFKQYWDKVSISSDKGDYYVSKEKYNEALDEYKKSLESLNMALMLSKKDAFESSAGYIEIQIGATLVLVGICYQITRCFNQSKHYQEAVVFCKDFRLALEALEPYKDKFNLQNLKLYDDFSEKAELMEDTGELGALITKYKNTDRKDILVKNDILEQLCKEFEEVCKHEACLVKSQNKYQESIND